MFLSYKRFEQSSYCLHFLDPRCLDGSFNLPITVFLCGSGSELVNGCIPHHYDFGFLHELRHMDGYFNLPITSSLRLVTLIWCTNFIQHLLDFSFQHQLRYSNGHSLSPVVASSRLVYDTDLASSFH
jgi:hypothetical protein